MSTYSHQQGTAPQYGERAEREASHPVTTVIGVILGAVVVGALVGLLLAAMIQGPVATQAHRAGAHGRVTSMHRLEAGAAGVAVASASAAPSLSARVTNELRLRGRLMSGEYSPRSLAVRRLHHTARA
jgi:predicted lipid-binding transport protein (Tim44 family)